MNSNDTKPVSSNFKNISYGVTEIDRSDYEGIEGYDDPLAINIVFSYICNDTPHV